MEGPCGLRGSRFARSDSGVELSPWGSVCTAGIPRPTTPVMGCDDDLLRLLCLSGLLAAQPDSGDLERRFRDGNEAARLELLRGLSVGDPSVAKQAMPVLIRKALTN